MKRFTRYDSTPDEPGFGSRFDPILNGVAQGLASLFPPVEAAHARRDASEAASASADTADAESRHEENGTGS